MFFVASNPRTPSAFSPHRTRADAPTASRRNATAVVDGADETLEALETHRRVEDARVHRARARNTDARGVDARIAREIITTRHQRRDEDTDRRRDEDERLIDVV